MWQRPQALLRMLSGSRFPNSRVSILQDDFAPGSRSYSVVVAHPNPVTASKITRTTTIIITTTITTTFSPATSTAASSAAWASIEKTEGKNRAEEKQVCAEGEAVSDEEKEREEEKEITDAQKEEDYCCQQ